MNTQQFYAFYKEQKTDALLSVLKQHCRSMECRKSFLALCYELRKRGVAA